MSLRKKVFAFDFSAWNHSRRAKRFAPFIGAAGAMIGTTIHFLLVVHLVDSQSAEYVLRILVTCGAVFGAFALFALFD